MTPSSTTLRRRELARLRACEARESFAHCELCARRCGANRFAGEVGPCHAGTEARVFSAQVEVSDERELSPCFAIAFSGCDMRCVFCITGAESWNPRAGEPFDSVRLARKASSALAQGARTIMILGGEPTVHLPSALELVGALPEDARLVWKTNAQGTERARRLLEGVFDVWVADFKFGNDACAERLAGITNYLSAVTDNLLWAQGDCELIVRHVLMPGHLGCCWRPVAEWMSNHLPAVKINLRFGFWSGWQSSRRSELRRCVSDEEQREALRIASQLHLKLVH